MNIHFGFSYIGLIFLLMLMLPNIIWSKNKPKGYDKYVKNENKVNNFKSGVSSIGFRRIKIYYYYWSGLEKC